MHVHCRVRVWPADREMGVGEGCPDMLLQAMYPVRSSFPGRGTTTRARRDGAEWHNLLPWWPHLREDEEEEEGAGDY